MQNYTGGSAGPIAGSMVSPVGFSVVDFSIPAGVRRITLLSSGLVVPSGCLIRLGTSDGMVTTGYNCASHFIGSPTGLEATSTVGALIPKCNGASGFCMTFYRGSSNNWNFTGQSLDIPGYAQFSTGNIQLPGDLTTFRYFSPSTITAGSLQLLWEF